MATSPNYSKMIQQIRATLPETGYEQTMQLLFDYFQYSCYTPQEALNLAGDLLDADNLSPLTPDTVKFMMSVFKYFIAKGNADAMNDMGCLYYGGRMGEPDYKKAIRYYTMAEENGSIIAAENLGYCYYYGRDGKTDYRKAYQYFSKGALAKRSESMYKIGDMYRYGYYVKADPKMAAQCYFNALEYVEKEEPEASYRGCVLKRVGDLYYEGIGVRVDYRAAHRYYHFAEVDLMDQYSRGDQFHVRLLDEVVERIDSCREKLREEYPCLRMQEN